MTSLPLASFVVSRVGFCCIALAMPAACSPAPFDRVEQTDIAEPGDATNPTSGDSDTEQDGRSDGSEQTQGETETDAAGDGGTDAASVGGTDAAGDGGGRADAADYCEATVGMFCPYYMRCGRMAVDSLEACEEAFLEACNARYEPLYVDLEARGLLALSAEGIERCRSRLETVACEDQIFDLDGCPDLWIGKTEVGQPCGPGLESFVCGEDATCLIDLSFCGTCMPLAGDEPCDLEHRCPDTSTCREGVCVARVAVGEACGDGRPCVLGARCEVVCKAPEVVGLGEVCGGERRCPYKAACVSGRCAPLALIGEECGAEVGCASGHCDEGRCRAFGAPGSSCGKDAQCQSGRCDVGLCASVGWSCLP